MELELKRGQVASVTANQIRQYMDAHTAEDYLLVDVRQPEEYEQHHIPGARLIPLLDVEERIAEIQTSPEPVKIFYCHSGSRSAYAARIALDYGVENVVNMTGGIVAWRGEILPSMPNLRAFEDADSVHEALIAALDLEKGAHRLYEALHEAFVDTPLERHLKKLVWAEANHEHTIYQQLRKRSNQPVPSFEELMEKLRGDVIESGEPIDEVLATARQLASFGGAAVLELALELELRAFDMYRALAHGSSEPDSRAVFLDLANQERAHAEDVLHALAKITSDQSAWMG